MILGRPPQMRLRVSDPGEVVQLTRDQMHALIQTDAELRQRVTGVFVAIERSSDALAAFLQRPGVAVGIGEVGEAGIVAALGVQPRAPSAGTFRPTPCAGSHRPRPFATAWVAHTRLASPAVVLYAGLFVCVDIAYNAFEREVFRAVPSQVSDRTRRMARRRSLAVLAIFTSAILVAFVAPRLGFGLICAALILHLRPEAPPFTNR
jgi:hypothetical protein